MRLLRFALAFVLALTPLAANASGVQELILTSSSATACTSIQSPATQLLSVINTNTSAQTATLSFYDESGASPSCSSGDQIFSVVLGASAVVNFPILTDTMGGFLKQGLAYKLSASASNNIVVLYR